MKIVFIARILISYSCQALVLLLLLMLFSCSDSAGKKETPGTVIHDHNILRAERLRVEKADDYTRIIISNPWQGAKGITNEYYLIQRGKPIPEGVDSSKVIYVPVKRIICMSTTHTAMILALNEESSIIGMSGTNFSFSEKLKPAIENGAIEDVGYEGNLNNELILKLSPDLIMMYGVGNESAGYTAKIEDLGIKVIFNADYLETDPLGKTEWIKLFGALYCKESMADSIYSDESAKYNDLSAFVEGEVKTRPQVLLGLPYKDTWFVSPGNSFISKIIKDAGGSYIWKDTRSDVSMPYGLENVYIKALNADYWLNTGSANTSDDIMAVDPRLMELPCFKSGNLYNNNKRISIGGGNDYWESGTLYPHLILKDIAAILHPEIFKNYELYYYTKLH
jgi:iron complex transport system substrate-binding protein